MEPDMLLRITSDAAIAQFEYIYLSNYDDVTNEMCDKAGRRISSVRPDCRLSVLNTSDDSYVYVDVRAFRWHPYVIFTEQGDATSDYENIPIAAMNNWHSGPGTQKALTLLAMRHVPRLYTHSTLHRLSMDVIYMIARLLLN
jgi:hypothetical protein